MDFPLVSVITPCLNMAEFVGETVRSVLGQDYPNIEHIVMDGGSTDGTLDVLGEFGEKITVVSEADEGAPDAINRGFRRCRGEIAAFLNADDFYLPGAVSNAVRGLRENPETAAVYGEGFWVDRQGERIGRYPTRDFDAKLLGRECFICQPAVFMRRAAVEEIGLLDIRRRFTFDYDLWIRLSRRHSMVRIDAEIAASRMHRENITLGRRKAVLRETMKLLKEHFGYVPFQWVHGYASFLADGRDQFYEPLRPTFLKHLLSLPVGLWENPFHPVRFLREWAGVMTVAGFRRRWRESRGGRRREEDPRKE